MMLSSTSIFFAISAFLCVTSAYDRYGILEPHELNLVCGNRDSKLGEFPYTVVIQGRSTLLDYNGYFDKCSGAILSPTFVLTTSNCLKTGTQQLGTFRVVAGGINSIKIMQVINVVEYWFENYYSSKRGPDNIGLVRLESPLTFNEYVNFIRLPKADFMPQGTAVLTGWGAISKIPTRLKEPSWVQQTAEVPIIPNQECLMTMLKFDWLFYMENFNLERDLCTGPFRGDTESCSTQTGSPLVQNGTLIGMLSKQREFRCACMNPVTIYYNVAKYLEFIDIYVTDLPYELNLPYDSEPQNL